MSTSDATRAATLCCYSVMPCYSVLRDGLLLCAPCWHATLCCLMASRSTHDCTPSLAALLRTAQRSAAVLANGSRFPARQGRFRPDQPHRLRGHQRPYPPAHAPPCHPASRLLPISVLPCPSHAAAHAAAHPAHHTQPHTLPITPSPTPNNRWQQPHPIRLARFPDSTPSPPLPTCAKSQPQLSLIPYPASSRLTSVGVSSPA